MLYQVVTWIVLGAVAVGIVLLARVAVRFRRQTKAMEAAAAAATPAQLDAIYACIEKLGDTPFNGYVIVSANRTVNDPRRVIPLPRDLTGFPWGGRAVIIDIGKEVTLRIGDDPADAPMLAGTVYRALRVPRFTGRKSRKIRNVYEPSTYLRESKELLPLLREISATYPKESLNYLLTAGTRAHSFDPIDQARIGASVAWIQDPDSPDCPLCRKRMASIVQVPGVMLKTRGYRDGNFYLFGCVEHPEQIAQVFQNS